MFGSVRIKSYPIYVVEVIQEYMVNYEKQQTHDGMTQNNITDYHHYQAAIIAKFMSVVFDRN